VLGDLLLDVVVAPERPIEEGTDVPGTLRLRRGGSAANVAEAFVRQGGRAMFIGAVGRDDAGRRLVAALRGAGVVVHAVRATGESPTGRLAAVVSRDGQRSFVTERGAADLLGPSDVRASWLGAVACLHLPGYSLYKAPLSDAASAAARMVRDRGAVISIDISSRAPMLAFGRGRTSQAILNLGADVLFANEEEARALVGADRPERLLELAPTVVVKEGPAGCRVLWKSGADVGQLAVATTPVATADTTGAGDAFAAGFLLALLGAPGRPKRWESALLRRAALAGHRSAAALLRSTRRELTR
jgi:sugar/nucleoside kinase (ribokinase family)